MVVDPTSPVHYLTKLCNDPLLTYHYPPRPPSTIVYTVPPLFHQYMQSSDFQRSKAHRIPFKQSRVQVARAPWRCPRWHLFWWEGTNWSSTICPVAQNKIYKLTLQMQYLDPKQCEALIDTPSPQRSCSPTLSKKGWRFSRPPGGHLPNSPSIIFFLQCRDLNPSYRIILSLRLKEVRSFFCSNVI